MPAMAGSRGSKPQPSTRLIKSSWAPTPLPLGACTCGAPGTTAPATRRTCAEADPALAAPECESRFACPRWSVHLKMEAGTLKVQVPNASRAGMRPTHISPGTPHLTQPVALLVMPPCMMQGPDSFQRQENDKAFSRQASGARS